MTNAIMVIEILVTFGLSIGLIISYRMGVNDGMRLASGKELKPITKAIAAVKHKGKDEETPEQKKMREQLEYIDKFKA